MTRSVKPIFELSPKRRALLKTLRQKKGMDLSFTERIPRREGAGPAPLSFAQERLWFLDQLEPDNSTYNVAAAARLKGSLSISALEASINEIVRRHEVLRTTFAAAGGRPVQVVASALHLALREEDLRGRSEAEAEDKLNRIAAEEAQRPFDLSRGPLLRVTLLSLGEQDRVMLVVMHHIICDGWSKAVFIREVGALYEAYLHHKPSPLPELPIQYADFADWQREWLQGEVLAEQLSYWKQQLGGKLPSLELCTDHPRPPVETYRGAVERFVISGPLTARLKELSHKQEATLFMTLLAGLKVLLLRYTGQADILIGSPIANRTHSETEELIGFFVNTLVLRTGLSGNPTFKQVLGRVKEVSLSAYTHQHMPFEKLVEELHPERDRSLNPIFQIMFALQNAPTEPMQLTGLEMTAMEIDTGATPFDLMLLLTEEGEELKGSLEYNTDLFDASTIKRLIQHYCRLMQGVVTAPETPIWSVPLLSDKERRQLLVEWNETKKDYDAGRCVHQWFESQVEQIPDDAALVFEGEQLSYSQLNRSANQLAHYLRRLGVGPEVLVGICVERSADMVIGLLAVLKAGGAGIALDPTYPKDRLAYIIEDAPASLLLTHQSLSQFLPEGNAVRVCLERCREEIAQQREDNPVSGVLPGNLMYAIYTSGSTGVPKGIGVTHAAFMNLIQWQYDEPRLSRMARTIQASTFGFCVSFQEIFSALCSGSALVLVSEETRRNIEALADYLKHSDVERLHLPFASLKHLADVCSDRNEVPAQLREIITAGEQLQVTQSIRNMFSLLKGCSLHNHYGASETHVVSSYSMTGDPAGWPTLPAAGSPIANARIYLLDPYMQPVAQGVSGEIYIGGICLARAYLNDPELTAGKFVPDPFSREPGDRLYKTGDMARHLADGNINYLGRIDQQVKVRGFRVELGEIEMVLRQHEAVRDVAVVPHTDAQSTVRLVAYVSLVDERVGAAHDLRNFLKLKLPEYLLPATFVFLAELPINANGKLDHQALPAPGQIRPDLEESFVAPRNPVEAMLASIWMEVLSLERVGINDNFFELGGHSLLATQVISHTRDRFRVELPLRSLFESPTIARLAESIETALRGEQNLPAPPIKRYPRNGPFPTSFAQQRMWFFDQLKPGNPFYNIPAALRLTGPLNQAVLKSSINHIIDRHEALRTTFAATEDGPVQIISPTFELALPVTDLSQLPEGERQAMTRRLILEEGKRPFDLTNGPLLRAGLLRLKEDDHALLLTVHHIIFDGWSVGVFMKELGVLYREYLYEGTAALPELQFQYADFARWQREWLQGEALNTRLSYWRKQLAGISRLKLPTDRPRLPVESFRGARRSFTVAKGVTEALAALSKRAGVTLFMTLVAAFKVLLNRYTGQEDILIGTPIANRNRGEIEGLIGCFVNTLVLRTDLSGDPSFSQLLKRVSEVTLEAYAYQDLPFDKLIEDLHPDRDASRNPLFQVMFVLHNNPMPPVELPDLTFTTLEVDSDQSKLDLTLSMMETPQGLLGSLEYNPDLFDGETIARMVERFQTLLAGITTDHDQRLSDQRMMSEAELDRLSHSRLVGTRLSQKELENLILELGENAGQR
jgi:amino acid adenylation domain-containing protein